jgi:hypothetical protein
MTIWSWGKMQTLNSHKPVRAASSISLPARGGVAIILPIPKKRVCQKFATSVHQESLGEQEEVPVITV